jgi:sulfide:quinone oxidoreductase
MSIHHQIIVVGGGTGGIMVAAQLLKKLPSADIAIIEPSDKHFYQPAYTLVGAGTYDMKDTIRPESSVIPKGAKWIKEYVGEIIAEQNKVKLTSGKELQYDYLVLSPGVVMNMNGIEGLEEALKTDSVCSNYIDPEKTWKILQEFKGGNAVFTQPAGQIKCGGAPQKIMYLAEDYFRKNGLRDKTNVVFATPGSVIFGVRDFARTLEKIIIDRDIIFKTFYTPFKVDSVNKKIYYRYTKPGENGCVITEDNKINERIVGESEIEMSYDILHIVPPQMAPDFVRNSSLAVPDGPNKGWLDVDINTLQHKKYNNVFGVGDVAALPTAKTGAAIRKQAPVVVGHIVSMIKNATIGNLKYEGYSSCPLVTGYGKMVLAEFKYDNVRDSDPLLSKFFDTTKELRSMWILKKYVLPYLYWNKMMKGEM